MVYFRPLVMAILKTEPSSDRRMWIFRRIERFLFLAFRTTSVRANYRSSEFYNVARALDRGEVNLQDISGKLDSSLAYTFNEDGTLRISEFHNLLYKKFVSGGGYYGWPGVRYFLYEYEGSLLSESRQRKVDWADLLKTEKDKISVEHIYPQTETPEWASVFESVRPEDRRYYSATLGNLLLLSTSINSALQNDSFSDKKKVNYDAAGHKVRNGYSDGSHSEIEVSHKDTWGPDQIRERGLALLRFMEERWEFSFKSDPEREKLLFLSSGEASA
jgi:hypothetical protein